MEAVYYAFGDYDKAAIIAYDLLKIAKQTKDSTQLYFAYSSIGADENIKGNDDIEFLLLAHKFAEFDKGLLAKSNIELSMVYLDQKKYDLTKNHLTKAIKIAVKENNLIQLSYGYTTMIDYLYETKEYNNALEYVKKVDSLVRKNPFFYDFRDILNTRITTGLIYSKTKKYNKATQQFKKALKLATKANEKATISLIYESWSDLEELKGNYIKSLSLYKKHTSLDKEIFNKESSFQLNALKVKYDFDKKDLEIDVVKKKEGFIRKQFWYLLTITIAIVLLLIVFILFLKNKLKTFLANEELTNQKNKNKNIEIKNLELEIELKNKKLADIFLYQYEKAKLLKNVVENVNKSTDDFKNILKEQFNQNEDWQSFKFHFDKVHEGFFNKLKKLSNNLTPKDIRYCVYIRMNLTSKEIAIMLGVSYRTVEGIRGRVRKKLKLNSETDIVLFLMNL